MRSYEARSYLCTRQHPQRAGKLVEDEDLFQVRFPDVLWEHVRNVVRNLKSLPIWVNKDATISSAVFGGKQTYDFWKHILDTGMTPANVRVLAKPVVLSDLLQ